MYFSVSLRKNVDSILEGLAEPLLLSFREMRSS